jgi:hypothetical protein
MTGATAAGGSGEPRGEAGTPAKGAPEEPDPATPDDDVEIHDPEVAAALAAFEAALGPMISKPRSPVVAGPDVPASPAAAGHDASAPPAAGPDVPASPAAGQDHAPAAPVTAGHDSPARPATGPDTPASPATGPDAPARPDLPAPAAASRRKADDAPPRPLAASKPPTRPKPVPRTTFPAPPVRRPVNGRSAAALPAGPSVIGAAPSADRTPRNGRTPPLTRPAAPAPPRPTPFPTPPRPRIEELAGGGSGSRRRSVLTVLAVALALVAAVLIPFAVDRARDDASGSPPQAGPKSASPTDPASGSPRPEAAAPPPAGFRLHRDRTGFSIAIPSGWREERDGSIVDFRDPTSSRFIRIDQRADPRTDPYDDWIGLEPTYKRRLPGYDLLRIENVPYRGWPAADWEFTWGASGSERSHVRIRNVVPNQYHGYALYWSTTDSGWTKDLPYFDIFVRTFAPRAGR